MSEKDDNDFGKNFDKLWRKKYSSEMDFSVAKEPLNRKQIYNLKKNIADPMFSTIEIYALKMEMPTFIVSGFLKGEIHIDNDNNWIVKKTGQIITQYKP